MIANLASPIQEDAGTVVLRGNLSPDTEIKHDRIIGLTSVSYPIFGLDDRAEAVITCPYFDHVPGDFNELKDLLYKLSLALTKAYLP